MLPLRAVAEAADARAVWSSSANTAFINNDGWFILEDMTLEEFRDEIWKNNPGLRIEVSRQTRGGFQWTKAQLNGQHLFSTAAVVIGRRHDELIYTRETARRIEQGERYNFQLPNGEIVAYQRSQLWEGVRLVGGGIVQGPTTFLYNYVQGLPVPDYNEVNIRDLMFLGSDYIKSLNLCYESRNIGELMLLGVDFVKSLGLDYSSINIIELIKS